MLTFRHNAQFSSAAVWCAIALGFTIPISTAASNLLLALTLLFFLLSGNYRDKWQFLSRPATAPAALAALAFCALAILGCGWGAGNAQDKLHYLTKYLSLLLIPLLIPLFSDARARQKALAAFCAAMTLTLLLSFLLWFDALRWLPPELHATLTQARDPEFPVTRNAVVFKLSITHGFLMALAAYLLLLAAVEATTRSRRLLLGGLAALMAFNVLFMIIGRTGHVVLAVLVSYFLLTRYRQRPNARQLGALLLGLSLLAITVWQFSPTLQTRADKAITEARQWQAGRGDKSSIGLRLDYYRNTLAIIQAHPLLGVGSGGFPAAYDTQVQGTAMARSNNPHNQYLLTTAQYGLPGLLLLLTLYAACWRAAAPLPAPQRQAVRGVLLAFLVGNLFNSFLLDFSERLFFAWACGVLLAGQRNEPASPAAESRR